MEKGCLSSREWPEPDPVRMALLIAANLVYLVYGGFIIARRKPGWMPVWLAALLSWFTLCKYLICTRCERFGEACDFYYLGKWAARLFKRQEGQTLDGAGIAAEGSSVALIQFLPALACLGSPRTLLKYGILLLAGQWAQLSICCRRCVAYSRDSWKREFCPSYKMARRLFAE